MAKKEEDPVYLEYLAAVRELAAQEAEARTKVAEIQAALKPANDRYQAALAAMNTAALETK